MYRTSAYPHLLHKFLDSDTTVLLSKVCTWSMSSSFWLVEGLLERVSLSTDVRPFLNQLYHSLICVMPMALSPKTRWIFWMVSTWLLPSFWQNLMQYRCLSRSIIFAENNNATCAAYTFSGHTLAAHNWRCLLAGKNPCMRMKVLSTFLPQHTSRASLVSAGKKSRHILFEQPTYGNKKVKLSHDRPEQAHRVPGG